MFCTNEEIFNKNKKRTESNRYLTGRLLTMSSSGHFSDAGSHDPDGRAE
jgi:hypothetical protein